MIQRTPLLVLSVLASLAFAGCKTAAFSAYSPRPRQIPAADVSAEIAALAADLEERATLRTPLGTARVRVTDLEPILARQARHRFAVLEERDVRATQETIRRELEMALGNRLNVVDEASATEAGEGSGTIATHKVDGTYLLTGNDIELSIRLVDLRDGWIVATAQRRIFRFEPRHYARPMEASSSDDARRAARQRTASVDDIAPIPSDVRIVADGEVLCPLVEGEEPLAAPLLHEGSTAVMDEQPVGVGGSMGVPMDEVIEFEVGPAAHRLEALGYGGAPPSEDAHAGLPD